jgi:uncharacterized protein (DUF2235 family)
MMREPKNIVVCLDGTRNSMVNNATNVIRIYQIVRNASKRQIAYYAAGVGTQTGPGSAKFLSAKFKRLAGMAFGYGTVQDVANAYRFIVDNYQAGDRLYFFGFSRGAYSARFLASVIHQIGLLPPGQTQLLSHAMQAALGGDPDVTQKFATMFAVDRPKVHFLGLFDTVKSGFYFDDSQWWPFRVSLPFSWDNPSVTKVRHAMAIDERRAFYPVNRWAEHDTSFSGKFDCDIEQVWFAGDHSDIGGGHPESLSQLCMVALDWMISSAIDAGLVIDDTCKATRLESATAYRLDPMHDRLAASLLWKICELVPRRATNDDEPRWRGLPLGRGRFVPEKAHVHASVRDRLADGRDAGSGHYAPRNLPADIVWIED